MKIIEFIKKITKIILYLSVSFFLVYSAVAYRQILLIEKTTMGSLKAVECKIKVADFQKINKLAETDPQIEDLKELCEGVSSQRVRLTFENY